MKILVRATNWVGDAVMCIPALEAIRRRWTEAHIAILARPWVGDIYQGQGLADRIIAFDHAGRHAGWTGVERLAAELRAEKYDAAVLLQNAFQAAWIAWRAGIGERLGYARDGRSWLLTKAVPVPMREEIPRQETYYYLELLRRAGWIESLPKVDAVRLRVAPTDAEKAEAKLRAAGARTGSKRVAVAPGAAYGAAKCWPVERFAAFADRAIAEFDADVILFGAPADRETTDRIAAAMRRQAVNLAGQTTIGELPALMAACQVYVGNDSGAMHVAAAAGLPVVAIFGPTDPEATAPLAKRLTVVREPVECSPCFLRTCPVDHRCMRRIEVEHVMEVARTSLMGYG